MNDSPNFRSADSASPVFANKPTVASCLHRPLTSQTTAVMGDNDESEIIEHHDDEEMEKMRTPRNHSQSFVESVASSEKDGYSSTQSSHRLLAYSDALISIIATVMVRRLNDRQTALDKSHGTFHCWECSLQQAAAMFSELHSKYILYEYVCLKRVMIFLCSQILPVAHTKFQDNEVKRYITPPFQE